MCATDRIESSIDAGAACAPCGEPTYGRHEVAGSIVDRRAAEAFDYRHVRG
jgi:hypothetical protein